jgi:1,4-alpha-glucan branching enzyme
MENLGIKCEEVDEKSLPAFQNSRILISASDFQTRSQKKHFCRQGVHADWADWYKRLLKVRKDRIIPVQDQFGAFSGSYHVLAPNAVSACWTMKDGDALVLAANLSDDPVEGFKLLGEAVLWHEGPEPCGSTMQPWSARWFFSPAEDVW